MKVREVRELGTEELKQKERDLVEELFKLRIRHSSGQLESPAMMRSVRKDIARIKTVLRQREGQEK
ncbi:MAG: 50S ribosomal protein L29 [Deltaproteobacteria bacterium]|nr:50S ribosomal protein L29 [Deltaproteobacteria bacterium]